jgi:hypothetical protein
VVMQCLSNGIGIIIFVFHNFNRHLLGEDLGPLSVKELQQLEKQLECALSQARQRKVHISSHPPPPLVLYENRNI